MNYIEKREKFYKTVNIPVLFLYLGTTFYMFIQSIVGDRTFMFRQCFVAWGLLILIPVITYVSKLYIPSNIKLLYYVFNYITVIYGSVYGGYRDIPMLDKITHFYSGFIFTIVGFILYRIIMKQKKAIQGRELVLASFFSFFFNITVAVIWEFYEYFVYIFLGIDAQRMKETLGHDTMQDMIVCTLGGILMLILFLRREKHHKSTFLLNCYDHFLYYNHLYEVSE